MFKRRIFDWKIRKNYKAKDKEMIAKKVKACVNSGLDLHSLSFQGRPVKLDRVKRHYRTDKRFSRLLETLSHSPEEDDVTIDEPTIKEGSPSTATGTLGPWRRSASSSDRDEMSMQYDNALGKVAISRNLSPPTDFYAVESTLFHTRDAIRWHFNSFKPLKVKELAVRFPRTISEEVKTGRIDQASEFWLSLYHGLYHLESGNSIHAWRAFDKCCQMVQPLLMSAPLHLLSCVLLHFATSWQGLNELEHHLLDFISSMASSVVGSEHPLALAFGMIATADVRDHVVESIMDLVTQGYQSRRKLDNSSLFALRVDQIDMLRKRKKFSQALTLCQQLVKDSQTMRKKRYRTALATLGRILADQGEEFGVESVAHRILDNEASDMANANSGGTTAWACGQLGSLCLNRGEYVVAEAYLRRAVDMTVQRYPNRGPSMASLTERLATCLQLQGKQVDFGPPRADGQLFTGFLRT